jgi:hypothetical protein
VQHKSTTTQMTMSVQNEFSPNSWLFIVCSIYLLFGMVGYLAGA